MVRKKCITKPDDRPIRMLAINVLYELCVSIISRALNKYFIWTPICLVFYIIEYIVISRYESWIYRFWTRRRTLLKCNYIYAILSSKDLINNSYQVAEFVIVYVNK